jgi:hypothetical protein
MTMNEEEDFTAAVRRPPPPLRPQRLILGAVVLAVIFGAVIAAALASRMAEDRRDHPDCATWRNEHQAMTNQVAADERAGDRQMGLVHQYQLEEWDKKRPTGCA